MSQLLRLLAFYYHCDQSAALRPLTAGEVAACMAHYDAIKAHFVAELPPPTTADELSARSRLGYARFKAWEVENPQTVAALRGT